MLYDINHCFDSSIAQAVLSKIQVGHILIDWENICYFCCSQGSKRETLEHYPTINAFLVTVVFETLDYGIAFPFA